MTEAESIIRSDTELYTVFGRTIKLCPERDNLLTPFGKQTLKDRYLWKGEDFQKMFARVAAVNSDNDNHAQRMYDYISRLWFMPATPVLSNSGHEKNLPISCFLNSVGDNLEEIFETFNENFWLASRGGGIGTSWSEVRDIGEPVADRGTTSGVIPFIKIQDSSTVGISQGSLRRGSTAAYLDVSHPEIEEFLEIRNPAGGDPHRKSLNIHHGVVVPNSFMQAVHDNADWMLISPHNGKVQQVVKARKIWQQILTRRLETGEPYVWFVDTVNDNRPAVYKLNNLYNQQSNLCSEIALSTSVDYNAKRRTAVCCLSSLNLETYDEWKDQIETLTEDCMRFLDNVMSSFIRLTDGVEGFERANYSAKMERSIGLGVMGFHSFLQNRMLPFEGVMAKVWNKRIFAALKDAADRANVRIALDRGSCPDAERAGLTLRFSHVFAIAPTASISIIAGESSPGIEPSAANAYKQKTLSGWFQVRNKYLDRIIKGRLDAAEWEDTWNSITSNDGSAQHLDFLSQDEKDVFKTAYELDQRWIIEHAADRQQFICQGQSVNIFVRPTVHKRTLNKLHTIAWEKGLKGLYYCRSRSIRQATKVSHTVGEMPKAVETPEDFDNGECLSCQ
jgi:ribonucleoside-diphosphate reductase alpha chain